MADRRRAAGLGLGPGQDGLTDEDGGGGMGSGNATSHWGGRCSTVAGSSGHG